MFSFLFRSKSKDHKVNKILCDLPRYYYYLLKILEQLTFSDLSDLKLIVTMSKAGSARIKDIASRRVLDDASRQRRARKALEALENDNNMDDPHADLVMSKKALSLFQDEGGDSAVQERRTKRKGRTLEYYKMRFRKNFSQLLEEETYNMMDEDEEDGGNGEQGPVLGGSCLLTFHFLS